MRGAYRAFFGSGSGDGDGGGETAAAGRLPFDFLEDMADKKADLEELS